MSNQAENGQKLYRSEIKGRDLSELRRLNKLDDKLSAFRKRYLAYSPNEQLTFAYEALNGLTSQKTADAVLDYQFGNTDAWLHDEFMLGLPDIAKQRMVNQFATRAAPLWPFVALDDRNSLHTQLRQIGATPNLQGTIDELMPLHTAVAEKYGLFPQSPELSNVPYQRLVNSSARLSFANIQFAQLLIQTRSFDFATAPFLAYAEQASQEYQSHPIDDMRAILSAKIDNNQDKINSLQERGLWDDPADLAGMCIDQGIRRHIINYYGIYRRMTLPPEASGYRLGQHILSRNSVMRDILRTTD